MKMAGYRSTETYLREARVRHVQLRCPLTDDLKLFFRGAERSVVRGRGPVQRAPVVRPEELAAAGVPGSWAVQKAVGNGPRWPWASFVASTWWLLRCIEALALKVGQCKLNKGIPKMAEIRLGETKADIEGRGKRRCFLCTCGSGPDPLCPACGLEVLLDGRGGTKAEQMEHLIEGPGGKRVDYSGFVKVLAAMCAGAAKYDDLGDEVKAEVSGHTPRRAGAQFHVRRGLQLWQVQYIGRWGSNSVEIYVGEALAESRAGWSEGIAEDIRNKKARTDGFDDVRLWEVYAKINELEPLTDSMKGLQAEMAEMKSEREARDLNLERELDALVLEDGRTDEFEDVVAEAKLDRAMDITPENLEAVRAGGRGAHLLNKSTGMAHAMDLELFLASDPSSWMTSCGWRFRSSDVLLKAGPPTGGRCSRKGCSLKFLEVTGEHETDDEPEGHL